MSRRRGAGRVVLVGAGPGDPELITLRGAAVLRQADALVYDSLAPRALLDLAPPAALRIDVGKRGHDAPTRSQSEINALLVELASQGKTVVRLKGGDAFVFGRGGEEASACVAAGIPFEVVPGVTSALAGPAYAGIPLTDRRHSASFAVVTGHRDASRPWTSLHWDRLATAVDTLVILMGMHNLEQIVDKLLTHGRAPDTPAAVVMEGTTRHQRVLEATLADLPKRAREAGLGAPAVVVVGDVVRLHRELAWYQAQPLRGWRVLVTRAEEQAGDLIEALRAAGAEPVAVPLIRAIAHEDPALLDAALAQLDGYDALLFTSANGVRFFAERARAQGRDLASLRCPVFCVGPASAAAAREVGLSEPLVPAERLDAEGLLALVADRLAPAGRRFLFPSAAGAREVLPRGLRAAGAHVDVVPVYRTVPAEVDADALRGALVRGELDALTFTSPSTVRHFLACLDPRARAALSGTVVVAIGAVTARALRDAGIEPDVVPARARARELADALAEYACRTQKEVP